MAAACARNEWNAQRTYRKLHAVLSRRAPLNSRFHLARRRGPAIDGVNVMPDGGLRLRYFVDGDIECVRVQERGPSRRETAWQKTCFEASCAGR
jgi:hypothetical protein